MRILVVRLRRARRSRAARPLSARRATALAAAPAVLPLAAPEIGMPRRVIRLGLGLSRLEQVLALDCPGRPSAKQKNRRSE